MLDLSASPQSPHIASYDPATLELLGEVRATPDAQLPVMLQAARVAGATWRQVPARERAARLRRVGNALVDQIDTLSTLISRETGKPRTEALATELFPALYLFDYFGRHGPRILRDAPINIRLWRALRRQSMLQRNPRGVVAIISPWNFPFSIPAGEIFMALLAGNSVLFKPARATCLVGEALTALFDAADLPHGTLQVVHGSGAALAAQPVNFIAFTGSVPVGKQILASAAQHLTPVMLELGGKDPMIVCQDANLEVAASTAVWGAFANAGQACASVERVYVQRSCYDAFVDLVVQKTLRLRQGNGLDADVDVGAMCTRDQFNFVIAHVRQAQEQGARVLCGGEVNRALAPGYFYKPTVLTQVRQDFACMQEETFGPTLPVLPFDTEEEAVRLANDSDFALCASVFTRNMRRGRALAEQLVAGTVLVNDASFTHGLAETPWGGPKNTGMGRTHGRDGLLEFTEPRHLHLNRNHGMKNPWVYPYSSGSYQLFKATSGLLRQGFLPKLRAAKQSLQALPGVLGTRL